MGIKNELMGEREERRLPELGRYNGLLDDSLMPYGTHKGVRMDLVPMDYLLWLRDQNKCSNKVLAYVNNKWPRVVTLGNGNGRAWKRK